MWTLLNLLFGCAHKHTTFPISTRGFKSLRKQVTEHNTYVVCLDCGKELPYSWEEMRMLPEGTKQTASVGEEVGSFSTTK